MVGKQWYWTYDDAGNILTRKEYISGTLTDTVTYGYTDSSWGDLLTSYDGKTITYDAIGNPLTYGNQTFTWKQGRQLATLNDGIYAWSYTYDANGMRKSRSSGSIIYAYTYNGSKLTQMTKGTDTLYFTYDAFGSPWMVRWNGTVYTYMTNLQGDVIAIVNTSNVAVVEYAYDAWGNILSITGSMANTLGTLNPLTYRGYVYDYETGLYYVSSRYYDPVWGRFLNSDVLISTGQGLLGNNMFAYCRNNPVCRKDITGTTDVACADDGTDLLDEEKSFNGGKISNGNSNSGTNGFGYSSSNAGNASSSVSPTAQTNASNPTTALQPYYPPNDGFKGEVQKVTLQPGTLVQRTGGLGGKYVAPAGTPTQKLSLPYEQLGQPTTTLEVRQPVVVSAGFVAPWFGQIGGGVQYKLDYPLIQYVNADVMRVIA